MIAKKEGTMSIIDLFERAKELPVVVSKRRKYCQHDRYVVDGEDRTVSCARCGATLDPFDAIYDVASKWGQTKTDIENLTKEKERLERDITNLDRMIRNAKARLRRAR